MNRDALDLAVPGSEGRRLNDDRSRERFEAVTKPIARNSAIVLSSRLMGRVLRFVTEVALGRLLGPSAYGVYVLGFSMIEVIKTLSMLGFDRGGLRYSAIAIGAGNRSEAVRVVRLALMVSGIAGIGAGGLLVICASTIGRMFDESALGGALRLFAISVPFLSVGMATSGVLQGVDRMRLDCRIQEMLRPTLHLLLLVALVTGVTGRVEAAVLAFDCAAIASAVIGLKGVRHVLPEVFESRLELVWTTRNAPVWHYSMSILLVQVGALGLLRLDKLLVGGLGSSEMVGLYGAASIIALQNRFPLQAINTAFSPYVARLYHQGRVGDLEYLLKLLNRWTIMATMPITLIVAFLSPELAAMMGAEFQEAWPALVVLSVGLFLGAGLGSIGVVLNMSGNQRLEVLNTLSSVVMLAGLMIVLVRPFGVLGAAVAVTLTRVAMNLLRITQLYRLLRIHPFRLDVVRVLLAGCAAMTTWLLLDAVVPLNGVAKMLTAVAVIGVAYLAAVSMFALSRDDRHIIAKLCRIVQPV